MMLVLGLTGSVGMGKSTVAAMFAEKGVATFDADATVHALYRGAAVPLVEAAFPGTLVDGAIDRKKLADKVIDNPPAMAKLEAIVHPLVRQAEKSFRARTAGEGRRTALLDIPLLLETGGESRVDAVVLVSAAPEIQEARVLARPGMTRERLDAILKRQMPDDEKRRRAHFIVDTGGDFAETRRQVADVLRAVAGIAAGG
jgi:dephospho-CoA kinase